MPLIKIDHVISFSSEDSVHVANNILSTDTSKKWVCKTPGEKNAIVVLQLEKASLITAIDIGNEHSAYVEVLVSRAGMNDDYKVLLIMSSFMSPLESRQSQNVNKVRMFTKDQLSQPECDEKWDRVKVVCTQPFNKHVQFGLSFVNFRTSDGSNSAKLGQTHIGKFTVRPESPDNVSVGSLFLKRKELKTEEKLTGAAAIREASSPSSLAAYGSPGCKPKLKIQSRSTTPSRDVTDSPEQPPRPRNRNEILYAKDEEEPNERIDKIVEKKTKEVEEKRNSSKDVADKTGEGHKKDKNRKGRDDRKPLDISLTSPSTAKKAEGINGSKRKSEDSSVARKRKKLKAVEVTKPFNQLLEGVTVVISGIQNPDRGNLRSMALSMGAKYKSDWGSSCTHLICAFANTPKFNQVKGKGKIVKKTWIEDCHSQRKKLPWRRYALDKNDAKVEESEEEICEKVGKKSPVKDNDWSEDDTTLNDDADDHQEEASDTEERLARIERLKDKEKTGDDVFSAETDLEEDVNSEEQLPSELVKLPDIFDDRKFHIDETFDEDLYDKLVKYIVAYKGKAVRDATSQVDFIVTSKSHSDSWKEVNSEAQCIGPSWIWKCHNKQRLVPVDGFLY